MIMLLNHLNELLETTNSFLEADIYGPHETLLTPEHKTKLKQLRKDTNAHILALSTQYLKDLRHELAEL